MCVLGWYFNFITFLFAINVDQNSVIRQPLHLSSFTLDEYEHALQHSLNDPPCNLIAEIHSVLIYNLRTIPFQRHAAVLSLLQEKESERPTTNEKTSLVSIDKLLEAVVDVGNNWERVPLKHGEDRQGWEEALIGCLKDVAVLLYSFVRFLK